MNRHDRFSEITVELCRKLDTIRFSAPVAYIYNPLEYARSGYDEYCRRYGSGKKEAVLVGMNPGPWGMAQTGVPFGDIVSVTQWMGIRADIGTPSRLHPKRPIHGFSCRRREVSGTRLWGWAHAVFGTPDTFFSRLFVVNYCPLLFYGTDGRNYTPDKLPAHHRRELFTVCDKALCDLFGLLDPRVVVGIGRFAEQRIGSVLEGETRRILTRIPHPSPANPQANRNWAQQVTAILEPLGVIP
jgi:single-strand selective monofunctional uracil DNA glycosylase